MQRLYENIHDILTKSNPPYCPPNSQCQFAIVMLALYKYYGDGLQRYLSVYTNKAFWSGDTICCKIQMKNTELGANPVTLGNPGKSTIGKYYTDGGSEPYDDRDDVFFTICCPPKPVQKEILIEKVRHQLLVSIYDGNKPSDITLTPLVSQ